MQEQSDHEGNMQQKSGDEQTPVDDLCGLAASEGSAVEQPAGAALCLRRGSGKAALFKRRFCPQSLWMAGLSPFFSGQLVPKRGMSDEQVGVLGEHYCMFRLFRLLRC